MDLISMDSTTWTSVEWGQGPDATGEVEKEREVHKPVSLPWRPEDAHQAVQNCSTLLGSAPAWVSQGGYITALRMIPELKMQTFYPTCPIRAGQPCYQGPYRK